MDGKSVLKVIAPLFFTLSLIACGHGGGSNKAVGAGSNDEVTEIGMTIIPPDATPPDDGTTPPDSSPPDDGTTPPDSNPPDDGTTPPDSNPPDDGTTPPDSSPPGGTEPPLAAACAPDTFAHLFELGDGTIWITQVYAFIDEIEFEHHSRGEHRSVSEDDDSLSGLDDDHSHGDKRVVDLTRTDDNVPDSIQLIIPEGRVAYVVKLKIKRLENEGDEQPVNVLDLDAFLSRIGFTENENVRPSIFIEGLVGIETDTALVSCKTFKLVTDRRWVIHLPFSKGSFDVDTDEAIIHFDIESAARAAMVDGTPIKASDLFDEIGKNSDKKPLGDGFLDARFKKGLGKPVARAWASQLASNMGASAHRGKRRPHP